jgi:ribosome-binding factor A
MSIQRARRVGEEIKKELSQIIHTEMKDPRLGFLSITDAETSPDLRYVKVFVSIMGSEKEQNLTLEVLQRASGFLRSELARRIRLRYTPELSFHLDNSIENGARIEKILRELESEK